MNLNRKINKLRSMKIILQHIYARIVENYYILTYCLHNEGKSVIAESCIKTLKAIKNDSK